MSGKKKGRRKHGAPSAMQKLLNQLEEQVERVSLEEQVLRRSATRQAILADFVAHSELVLYLLQHGVPLPPQAQAGCPSVDSYVAERLLAVTQQQLDAVASWKGEDDIKALNHDLFQRLVVLLELIDRPPAPAGSSVADDSSAGASGGGGSSAAACGSNSASGSHGSATSTAMLAAPTNPAECLAAVEAAIDSAVSLTCVGLLFNVRPIVDSAGSHQLSPAPTPVLAHQGHWASVVRRCQLSDEQAFQLAIAAEEYARLSRGEQAQGRALLAHASSTRALLAAEAEARASSGGATGSAPAAEAASALQTAASDDAGGTSGAAAADGDPTPDLLAALFQRHLDTRMLHMTVVSLFLLNTLTKVQIARMIVGSYPLQVITAAVVEAAGELHQQKQAQSQAGAGAAQAAVSAVHGSAAVCLHMQRRREAMQQQLERWSQSMGLTPP